MITKYRSDYVSGVDETVYFGCLGPSDHGNPSHERQSHVFSWPGYSRNYEEKWEQPEGGKNDWKNFEHFRSTQGNYSGSSVPIYTEKWAYNPHIHKGYSRNIQAGYHQWWYGSELEPYGSPGQLNNGLPGFYVKRQDGGFVPSPANLDNLIASSLGAMLPNIKAELSLINSVLELKDFKSLASSIWRFTNRTYTVTEKVKDIFATMYDTWKAGRKVTLREMSREAGNALLSYKFALAPLLSDICGIHAALSRTERRMNDLVTRAGRLQRRHFTVRWQEYPNSFESGSNAGFGYKTYSLLTVGLYDVDRKVTYSPTTFHAEIEYSYYFTQYQLAHAQVLSLLDALGVNPNPSIIWNAIPWSFVVDWVIGVGRWLDSMKTGNMEPMINIRRYLWSVRRERSILVSKGITRSYYGLSPEGRSHLPVVTETAYRRSVGIPGWSSFYMSGISQTELMLGAALVVTRGRRRRKW